MKEKIYSLIEKTLQNIAIDNSDVSISTTKGFTIERPADISHGDFSSNIAMVLSHGLKRPPVSIAIEIVESIKKSIEDNPTEFADIESVEVAGPGFINFKIAGGFYKNTIKNILEKGDKCGVSDTLKGQKIAFEYTDPNPFKVFHIGHLMANTVGESLSRLAEFGGAEVKRYCYQGDVGRHVALTIWGLRFMDESSSMPADDASVSDKVAYFGKAYALGATEYKRLEDKAKDAGEVDENGRPTSVEFKDADEEVQLINKKVYDRSDEEINELFDTGKEWSLEHFEELYKILDTNFDRYFFESQSAPLGIDIVKSNTVPNGKSVFVESNGAIIFEGEKHGLHTRVFITRNGLPGYEAKDIGLIPLKYDAWPYDKSVIVTANEQDEYFKVVLKAAEFLFPEIAPKNTHISHGMLKLTTGKMSSRTGDVISGESLLGQMIDMSLEKMKDRQLSDEEKKTVSEAVAVSAIKYTILRQATGKDVIFDPEKSLSFEGDSGPYLQYSYVRARSLLEKAKEQGIGEWVYDSSAKTTFGQGTVLGDGIGTGEIGTGVEASDMTPEEKLSKSLERFAETAERAIHEMAPHHVANYLMDLAGTFNSYYANTHIINADDAHSPYKLALVKAFSVVMKNGLNLLGIKAVERM
jgi:arginyl-tRNA synthetase